jgi:hypothetical protein
MEATDLCDFPEGSHYRQSIFECEVDDDPSI